MSSHSTAEPLRTLEATAPSGGKVWFGSTADGHLAFYRNLLTADEDIVWWRAKLAAEKPGAEAWEKARALLIAAKWKVSE